MTLEVRASTERELGVIVEKPINRVMRRVRQADGSRRGPKAVRALAASEPGTASVDPTKPKCSDFSNLGTSSADCTVLVKATRTEMMRGIGVGRADVEEAAFRSG